MLWTGTKVYLLVIFFVAGESKFTTASDVSEINFRLPNATRPESYDLTIWTRVDEEDFSFHGAVKIDIIVIASTTSIILHQFQTIVDEIQLELDGNAMIIDRYSYNETLQFLTISVLHPLIVGNRYTLQIKYYGTLREDYLGLYRTSYLNESGMKMWLATTQFQAAEARQAFPCYDEPGIKVPFTLRITHGNSYRALSNMPIKNLTDNSDGTVTTEFEKTPPISTYIVAFMVSNFTYISDPNATIPQRAFARSNIINGSEFTLNVGSQLLDALIGYFGVDYSLPKLDQVAIPNFRYGAMENWGLVKYREDYFIYDENVSLYTHKFSIVRIVGHELVHQFFGNLVSPLWWTYLWLNEGFARYFEYKGIQLTHPGWDLGDNYFLPRVLQTVFQSDAMETSPPMNRYINHADNIDSQFSLITSDKAACVIRMFLNVVTEETFVKGLRSYLTDRSYSSAIEDDLFHFLEAAAREDNSIPQNLNITSAMSSWTSQSGFPLLIVTRNYLEATQQIVTFTQQRYLSSNNGTSDALWWIPLNFATNRNLRFADTQPVEWLPPQNNLTLNLSTLNENDWLMINMQATGYFRVLYDEQNYRLLSDAMVRNVSQFHMLNRGQIIDDTYNFVQTGRLKYDTFLNVIRFLEYVHDYTSWYAAVTAFNTIELRFSGSKNHPLLTNYMRRLSEHLYHTVGVKDISDEPLIRKYTRQIAIHWACKLGMNDCRRDASTELNATIETGIDFHQNVRDVLYCASLRNGSLNDFHNVWNRMQASNQSATRILLINALGCSSIPSALTELINSSLPSSNNNNASYTFEERISVFNSVYQGNAVGLEIAVQFLNQNNYEAFTTFGADNMQDIYIKMAHRIGRDDLIIQFKSLLDTAKTNNLIYDHIFDDAKKHLNDNRMWLSTHGDIISNWLLQQNIS